MTYPGEQLWRGRRDGRERIPLAGASVRAWIPRWSPDGRLVAFIGQAEGESLWDACWLPDGSIVFYGSAPDRPLRRVDVKTGVVSALPGSEGLRHPKCGRQGQILAMRHGLPPTAFVGRAEPNDWKEIGPSRGSYHSWTKDGRSFCSVLADRIDCYLLDEGRYETTYRLDHQPLDWIDGAPWMGLDLDDSPLVTMRVGKADLYALELEAPD